MVRLATVGDGEAVSSGRPFDILVRAQSHQPIGDAHDAAIIDYLDGGALVQPFDQRPAIDPLCRTGELVVTRPGDKGHADAAMGKIFGRLATGLAAPIANDSGRTSVGESVCPPVYISADS